MTDHPQGFWSSLPGVLTGIAAVITALTGLYIAMSGNNDVTQSNTSTAAITASPPDDKKITALATSPTQAIQQVPQRERSKTPTSTSATVVEQQPPDIAAASNTGPLVNCTFFPTVNTTTSLMSWSNHYHQQIIDANGVEGRAKYPCEKTIDYRAQAHCKIQDNPEVRQALFETLTLCRAAGIQVQDVIKQ